MTEIAIRVENLSKQFRIGAAKRNRNFREALIDGFKAPFQRAGKLLRSRSRGAVELDNTIWALKDVSFEIKQGEVVGVIGRNGAGKSTLLKVLSRITEPTRGFAEIRGRVGSLLEVGTGFHHELTGRENIFLNGSILGMKRAEIRRRFDEIVAFAEVEKFIDTPVKHYSSGMGLRLGFAVAAHLEPEILLVDEVLAVGDIVFQQKCLGKMRDIAGEGRTVLFVSHNVGAVQALCHRGILFSQGSIVTDTSAQDAVRAYVMEFSNLSNEPLDDRRDRKGNGQIKITEFFMENNKGVRINNILAGDDIRFCFAYKGRESLKNVHVAFNLQEEIGNPIIHCNTSDVGKDFKAIPEKGTFICEIKKFPLRACRYTGNLFITVNGHISDWIQDAFIVDVVDGDFYGTGKLPGQGKVLISQDWKILTTS